MSDICRASSTELLSTVIDSISLGLLRFSHMNALQTDPGYQKGIRMDKGFFDEDNFAYLEEQCIEYICKAKLTSTMRKVIKYLNEQPGGGMARIQQAL